MNIVINGIDLSDIAARQAALNAEIDALRPSIRRDAVTYIADAIKLAVDSTNELLEFVDTLDDQDFASDEDMAKIDAIAGVAKQALDSVELVAKVAAVSYMIPYNDYGYHRDDDVISARLEDTLNGVIFDLPNVTALYHIAEDMEDEVREWNTSSC